MKANCFNGLKHLHTLIQEGEESTFKVSLQSADKQQGEEETQQIIGYPSAGNYQLSYQLTKLCISIFNKYLLLFFILFNSQILIQICNIYCY